ncbi:MAG: peptide-methionine (S)-S-oxide reductase MsrA [Alteromonadaceae bacterium]|nr:peptide-methionine (S)-S-oxide reductase MsrA [Alteromonadaceae bacterium]
MNHNETQQAIVAGGCFWCIESAFNSVKGIESAVSGYMGGQSDAPTYEDICTGTTGHAEVVNLTFDPAVISYREILEIFFALHDPTQLNKQGGDVGTHYRSAIFFTNEEQQEIAENIITEINIDKVWPEPIVTEVIIQSEFFSGEDYHQKYFTKNLENQYCQAVVSPKLAKFKQTFVKMLK